MNGVQEGWAPTGGTACGATRCVGTIPGTHPVYMRRYERRIVRASIIEGLNMSRMVRKGKRWEARRGPKPRSRRLEERSVEIAGIEISSLIRTRDWALSRAHPNTPTTPAGVVCQLPRYE